MNLTSPSRTDGSPAILKSPEQQSSNEIMAKYIVSLEARVALMRDNQAKSERIAELEAALKETKWENERLKGLLATQPQANSSSGVEVPDRKPSSEKDTVSSSTSMLTEESFIISAAERTRSRKNVIFSDEEDSLTEEIASGEPNNIPPTNAVPETSTEADAIQQIESKHGKLVSWREVIVRSKRGNIGSLRSHQRESIKGAFRSFLNDKLGEELAAQCLLPVKVGSTCLEVALPETFNTEFQAYLDVKIAQGLLDHKKVSSVRKSSSGQDNAKRKRAESYPEETDEDDDEWLTWSQLIRRKYPSFKYAAWGNVFAGKYFSENSIPFKIVKTRKRYPANYGDAFIAAFEQKFGNHPAFSSIYQAATGSPSKKLRTITEVEAENAPREVASEKTGLDRSGQPVELKVLFADWKKLVDHILVGSFDDLSLTKYQELKTLTEVFLKANVRQHRINLKDCLDQDPASGKSEWFVPQPLWDSFLKLIQSSYQDLTITGAIPSIQTTEAKDNDAVHSTPQDTGMKDPPFVANTSQAVKAHTPISLSKENNQRVLTHSISHDEQRPTHTLLTIKPQTPVSHSPSSGVQHDKNAHLAPQMNQLSELSVHDIQQEYPRLTSTISPSALPVLTLPRLRDPTAVNDIGRPTDSSVPERVGYATIMRTICPTYNDLPREGRFRLKGNVRMYLNNICEGDETRFKVVQTHDGKPHHTYVVERALQPAFFEWARKELNSIFELNL